MEYGSSSSRYLQDIDYAAVIRHHGVLMTVSWCCLIPCGIASSLFLRHRNQHPKYFFFRPHYILATIGVVCAISGWIIAAKNFGFGVGGGGSLNPEDLGNIHAFFGRIVMWGSILSILLYPISMKLPRFENESWTQWPLRQKIGQFTHRALGYVLLVLGVTVSYTGVRLVHASKTGDYFRTVFVTCLVVTGVYIGLLCYDKYRFSSDQQEEEQVEGQSETTPLV